MRLLTLLPAAGLLMSCGILPLPEISIPEQSFSVPVPMSASAATMYIPLNFPSVKLPVSNLVLAGNATGPGSSDAQASVFITQGLPDCPATPGGVICPEAQGHLIGTMNLNTDRNAFALRNIEGDSFTRALKSGNAAIGVRLNQGTLTPGEIRLTELVIQGRL